MLALMGLFGAAFGGLFLIDRDDEEEATPEPIPDVPEDSDMDGIEAMLSAVDSASEAGESVEPPIDTPDTRADAPNDLDLAGAEAPDVAPVTDSLPTDGGDSLVGSERPDALVGLMGDDVLWGLGGDDVLTAGSGNDVLFGGDGDDTLAGGWGDDELVGGAGEDLLQGGWGDDLLDGRDSDDGFDYLNGGEGDDTLIAGRGDYLSGGGGADRFVVGRDFDGTIDDMTDEDRLELTWDGDWAPDLETHVTDAGVEIHADGTRVAVLRGLDSFDLNRVTLVRAR